MNWQALGWECVTNYAMTNECIGIFTKAPDRRCGLRMRCLGLGCGFTNDSSLLHYYSQQSIFGRSMNESFLSILPSRNGPNHVSNI